MDLFPYGVTRTTTTTTAAATSTTTAATTTTGNDIDAGIGVFVFFV